MSWVLPKSGFRQHAVLPELDLFRHFECGSAEVWIETTFRVRFCGRRGWCESLSSALPKPGLRRHFEIGFADVGV